jgi:hypothetical protein
MLRLAHDILAYNHKKRIADFFDKPISKALTTKWRHRSNGTWNYLLLQKNNLLQRFEVPKSIKTSL